MRSIYRLECDLALARIQAQDRHVSIGATDVCVMTPFSLMSHYDVALTNSLRNLKIDRYHSIALMRSYIAFY